MSAIDEDVDWIDAGLVFEDDGCCCCDQVVGINKDKGLVVLDMAILFIQERKTKKGEQILVFHGHYKHSAYRLDQE